MSHVLPQGLVFPFNFGFLPQTKAADGDELDILLIMEEPLAVGVVVLTKVIGAIRGRQTQSGKTFRNDRLLGVPVTSVNPPALTSIRELDDSLLDEVQQFFVTYNAQHGRRFRPTAQVGPREAAAIVTHCAT